MKKTIVRRRKKQDYEITEALLIPVVEEDQMNSSG
jgi:hypothetical protein